MKQIPLAPNYTIDETQTVRNSKGDPVKVDSQGRVALWSPEEKKAIKYGLEELWSSVYGEPAPLDNLWDMEEAPAPLITPGAVPPVPEEWAAKRTPNKEEVIHAICKYLQEGHKIRIVRELVLRDFPYATFSQSLVADIKGGWLHHSIVKQYGIKPQHRGMKKKVEAAHEVSAT